MKAIVVVDENWGIGKEGNLLVHLPGDLKYFKEKTLGKTLIMGRTTLESLPGKKPLPGRNTVVLTGNKGYSAGEGVKVLHSLEETLEFVRTLDPEDVFVAGGAEIYKEFLPYCTEILVTKIKQSFEADKYFPDLDRFGFRVVSWEEPMEEKGIQYQFFIYKK